jgi:hypothetical protein
MRQETSHHHGSPELQLQAAAKAVLALGDDCDAGRVCAALRAFAAAGGAPALAPGALASAAHLVLSRTILRHVPRLRRDPGCAPVMLEVTTVYHRFATVIRQATPPALLTKVLEVGSLLVYPNPPPPSTVAAAADGAELGATEGDALVACDGDTLGATVPDAVGAC